LLSRARPRATAIGSSGFESGSERSE